MGDLISQYSFGIVKGTAPKETWSCTNQYFRDFFIVSSLSGPHREAGTGKAPP